MAACRVSGVLAERLFLATAAAEFDRLSEGAFFGGIAAMLEALVCHREQDLGQTFLET
jgi:hypothetical protein